MEEQLIVSGMVNPIPFAAKGKRNPINCKIYAKPHCLRIARLKRALEFLVLFLAE